MPYNLTEIYTGGPADMYHGLTTQSNYFMLDATLVALFIIFIMFMASKTESIKTNALISATIVTVISALLSFAIGALGYPAAEVVAYTSRTLVWFALAALCLLWNVLT